MPRLVHYGEPETQGDRAGASNVDGGVTPTLGIGLLLSSPQPRVAEGINGVAFEIGV